MRQVRSGRAAGVRRREAVRRQDVSRETSCWWRRITTFDTDAHPMASRSAVCAVSATAKRQSSPARAAASGSSSKWSRFAVAMNVWTVPKPRAAQLSTPLRPFPAALNRPSMFHVKHLAAAKPFGGSRRRSLPSVKPGSTRTRARLISSRTYSERTLRSAGRPDLCQPRFDRDLRLPQCFTRNIQP